jgi:hypothetical protein
VGPLEELRASWVESETEFGVSRLSAAYLVALAAAAPGYRDFPRAEDARVRALMYRQLVSDIANEPVDAFT